MKQGILFIIAAFYLGLLSATVAELTIYFFGYRTFYLVVFSLLPIILYVVYNFFSPFIHVWKRILLPISFSLTLVSFLLPPTLFYIRPFTIYFSAVAALGCVILTLSILLFISPASQTFDSLLKARTGNHDQSKYFLPGYLSGYVIGLLIPISKTQLLIEIIGSLFLLTGIFEYSKIYAVKRKIIWVRLITLCSVGMMTYIYYRLPVMNFFPEQKNYVDKVIFLSHTDYHDITITQWKNYYWFFIDGLKYYSSADEYLFYEPFILPAVKLCEQPRNILVLGGENGCAVRELLKFPSIQKIDIVPMDTSYFNIARSVKYFLNINNRSLSDPKVIMIKESIQSFITKRDSIYDLVIIDLPDPRKIDYNLFYTNEFYNYCYRLLNDKGILTTQAGSPFYVPDAIVVIVNSIKKAKFEAQPIHNQVLTLGEWGWVIAVKGNTVPDIKDRLLQMDFSSVKTNWINKEAMYLLTSFGKSPDFNDTSNINTFSNPVVFQIYRDKIRDLEE